MESLFSAASAILEWIPFFRHRNTSVEILHHKRHVFENYLLSLDAIIHRVSLSPIVSESMSFTSNDSQLLGLSTNQYSKDTQDWLDPQTVISYHQLYDLIANLVASSKCLSQPMSMVS